MSRGYIYLISFQGTNDIYIGKTINDIYHRLYKHKYEYSTVCNYVKYKLNDNWNNVNIDVIDSIDMDEDLTYLFNHPLNIECPIKDIPSYKKFTSNCLTNKQLLNDRLSYTERFHIQNYKNEGKYNLINKKQIIVQYNSYEIYKFYQYS